MADTPVTSTDALITPAAPRWNWRRDLNYTFVALTEILWLVPLLVLVGTDAPDGMFPASLANIFALVSVNVLAALLLRRYLTNRKLSTNEQLPYLAGGTVFSLLMVLSLLPILAGTSNSLDFGFPKMFRVQADKIFPVGFVYTPIVIFLWLRGARIGKALLTPIGVSIQMRVGILVYFMLGLFGNQAVQDTMLTLLPLFFGCALMATALARAATLQIDEDTRSARFGLSWLGFISFVVVAITLSGFMLALVLAGIDRNQLLETFKLIAAGILTIVFIIFTPVFWVMEKVLRYLQSLGAEEGVNVEESGEIIPGKAKDVDRLEYGEFLETAWEFFTTGFGIVVVVGIAVIVIGFWLGFLLTRDNNPIGNEDSEDIDDRELIGGLRKTVGKQFKKIGDALNAMRQFGLGRGLVGALTIRWAYSRMEREAKKRGYPRNKAQTPYEYRRVVAQAFPGGEDHIQVITNAYVAIRYGELPEMDETLATVKTALDQLMAIPASST